MRSFWFGLLATVLATGFAAGLLMSSPAVSKPIPAGMMLSSADGKTTCTDYLIAAHDQAQLPDPVHYQTREFEGYREYAAGFYAGAAAFENDDFNDASSDIYELLKEVVVDCENYPKATFAQALLAVLLRDKAAN